jgi:hypothetical protein
VQGKNAIFVKIGIEVKAAPFSGKAINMLWYTLHFKPEIRSCAIMGG